MQKDGSFTAASAELVPVSTKSPKKFVLKESFTLPNRQITVPKNAVAPIHKNDNENLAGEESDVTSSSSVDEAIDVLESAINLLQSPSTHSLSKSNEIVAINPPTSGLNQIKSWTSLNKPQNESHLNETNLECKAPENIGTRQSVRSESTMRFTPKPPTAPKPSYTRNQKPNRYSKLSAEDVMNRKSMNPFQSDPNFQQHFEYSTNHHNQDMYAQSVQVLHNPGFDYDDGYINPISGSYSVSNIPAGPNRSNMMSSSYSRIHLRQHNHKAERELMEKVKQTLSLKQFSEKVRIDNQIRAVSRSQKPKFERRIDPSEIRKEIENEKLKRVGLLMMICVN